MSCNNPKNHFLRLLLSQRKTLGHRQIIGHLLLRPTARQHPWNVRNPLKKNHFNSINLNLIKKKFIKKKFQRGGNALQADRDVNQHPFPFFTLLPVSHSKSGAPLRQQKKKRALRKRTGRHRRRAEAADRRKQQPPQEADFFPEKSDEIRYPKRNRVCLCPVVHSGEISPFCSSSKGNFWGHVRTSIPVTRVSSFSHFGALPWQRAAPNSKFFKKKMDEKEAPNSKFPSSDGCRGNARRQNQIFQKKLKDASAGI